MSCSLDSKYGLVWHKDRFLTPSIKSGVILCKEILREDGNGERHKYDRVDVQQGLARLQQSAIFSSRVLCESHTCLSTCIP